VNGLRANAAAFNDKMRFAVEADAIVERTGPILNQTVSRFGPRVKLLRALTAMWIFLKEELIMFSNVLSVDLDLDRRAHAT